MSNHTKIAIVGISCRFPGGVENLDDYWQVLKNGEDVVTEIPTSRWNKAIYGHPKRKVPGHSYTFAAGVLSQIDQFDAEFFGISRREAEQMDPQQRLLLELAWEAIEDAGLCADKLAGSDCGVFIGLGSHDYSLRGLDDLGSMDAYTMTGNTGSIGSNRISYIFDLRGPSMSIDTACSSSLVALHQACNSIRSGESSMAITGGVNMLLHPSAFVGFSKASMLSPQGRCRAFDASGDGYVRSEGAALVMLKPLAQAEADGDHIYAVISASGANCDGKTNGIALPSSEAQADLLNKLYSHTAIDINDIAYIEAHGTGTAVGDPLETKALWQAIASKRSPDNPLLIGSAKTNLGHLEVASGMAGLLKTVLCLQHQAIPQNLHFKTPNPNIPFQEWNLKVVEKLTAIPATHKPLLMGVNSFGFGGANAHILLEQYQTPAPGISLPVTKTPPLFLSARNPHALKALAHQYAQLLESVQPDDYYNIAWSALTRRQALEHRLAVFADDKAEIAKKLSRFADEQAVDGIVSAEALSQPSRIAFVYSGNGSQWLGMGCVLFKENKVFQLAIKEVDKYWKQYADFSIIDELFANEDSIRLALTEVAQPTLFAVQVGLTKLLQSLGIKACAAFGHSVGEVAAAWAAEALTLKQAVHVIYERSFAQALTKGQGKMAAVGLSAQAMTEILTALQIAEQVVIAGINSPNSVTISGDEQALLLVETQMLSDNVFYKLLDLDYAFHSPYMDSIEARVLTHLAKLKPHTSKDVRFISTVTGKEACGTSLTAEYWWHNIRYPVEFNAAVQSLINDDVRIFIEIGSHPVLCRYVEQCLQHAEKTGRAIATVKRQEESLTAVTASVYQAHLLGAELDLSIAFPQSGQLVKLPSYPWQREHYWCEISEDTYKLIDRQMDNPLLGYRLTDADAAWKTNLDTAVLPWLADHEVGGAIVLPAAAYIEMALAASKAWLNGTAFEVEELDIAAPIVLDADHLRTITFKISTVDGTFAIRSRDYISNNVTGRLLGAPMQKSVHLVAAIPTLSEAPKKHDASTHYQLTQQIGLNYGTAFQGIDYVWLWPEQRTVWARLKLPEQLQASFQDYLLHPSLLDSCFQLLVDLFSEQIVAGQGTAMIPVRVGKLKFYSGYGQPHWCKLELKRYNRRSVVADFLLLDSDHNTVAILNNVRFRSVNFIKGAEHYPATYIYTTKLMPHLQASVATPIPAFKSLATTVIHSLKTNEEQLKRQQHFNEVLPLFDVLVSAYCWEAVNALMGKHQSASVDELINHNSVIERQIDLLTRLLAILKEDNLLVYQGDKCALVTDTDMPEAATIWRTILADYPQYLPELTLIAQCGAKLVEVLCGKIEPQDLLNPPKSSTQEHLFSHSQTWAVANQVVADILHRCVQEWPNNRRLRILEIGNGHCELTRLLIPLLPANSCDYVFIDTDENSISHALGLFERIEFFSAELVSLENLPATLPESLPTHSFDLLIASNSLYKSNDLEKTLSNAQQFLVSGGMFIIQERSSDRFTDLTCGLEPDWWLYNEETSAASARLLSAEIWIKLLEQQGFVENRAIIEPEALDNPSAFVILAKNAGLIAIPEPNFTPATWLLLIDADEEALTLYQQLKAQLNIAGQHTIALQAGRENAAVNKEHFIFNPQKSDSLALTLARIGNYQHIVHLHGWQSAEKPLQTALAQQRCQLTVDLLQALEMSRLEQPLSLWLITQGGAVYQDSEAQTLHPNQAALWGFGRVIMNEYPNLTVRLLDLALPHSNSQTAQLLCQEFLHASAENEIVITDTARKVMRMRRNEIKARPQKRKKTPAALVLDFKIAGSLNNLYWRTLGAAPALAADQIQIRPIASGLNFRDVMYAMGMLSDEAVENGFAGANLGMELSGVVERVGKNVEIFQAGDEVICFAPACFSTRVITQTTAVALKPKHWSHEQATTIPATFFTVYYALHHLARLQPGERVLIHGAAGGVGLAAIQYAQSIGAEIFATAGSPERRAFVKTMGADHVMDSRSMAFADEVMTLTNGQGVDVVLNSLSGEAIWRNLAILKPFGRFLELGKRDFYENSKIGLRPFRNNISYFGIDADQLLIERPQLAAQLFQEMMLLFADGVLKPLPFRVFPASQIVDAFRYMQQSRQIGKVVVSFEDIENLPVQAEESPDSTLKLDGNGSYLVTGGLGGFGLKTAQWLVEKGAKHLILLGRSGLANPIAAQAVQAMQAQGVTVYAHALDVCELAPLQQLFAQIMDSAPPLKGVIHAAAVIDDGLIRQLTPEQLARVLMPKIQGSWNLHQLTEKMNLDFFVLYSSMTTFLGNPGQANYVAANSYLESLAHYRRAQGLTGTYIAWGAIDDVGFLTRHENVKNALESRLGSKAIHSDTALAMLEKILLADSSGAAIINFDWATIARFMPGAKAPKYEQQLLQAKNLGADSHNHENIKSLLASLTAAEAIDLIAQLLAQEVGQILRIPAEKVDKQKSVFDLGMDSLMGMELAIAIEERFEVKLPLMALAEGATITKLAAKIVELLQGNGTSDESSQQQDMAKALISRHEDNLSEHAVNEFIERMTPATTGQSND